jgi:hypothetical protein
LAEIVDQHCATTSPWGLWVPDQRSPRSLVRDDVENGGEAYALIPAAHSRPSDAYSSSLSITERVQGMPGEGLTHGPPAERGAGGSHHRISQIIRHSLRDGFNAYT